MTEILQTSHRVLRHACSVVISDWFSYRELHVSLVQGFALNVYFEFHLIKYSIFGI